MQAKVLSEKRAIVEAKINGKKAELLVDTGASINILSKSKEKEFNFSCGKIIGSMVGAGVGSESDTYLLDFKSKVELSGFQIHQFAVGNLDSATESIKRETGISIDGIIGIPGIKQLELQINLSLNEIKVGY